MDDASSLSYMRRGIFHHCNPLIAPNTPCMATNKLPAGIQNCTGGRIFEKARIPARHRVVTGAEAVRDRASACRCG